MAEENKTTTANETKPAAEGAPAAEPAPAEPEKKFTQEDLDDAIEKRLARERRKWEREQKKQPAAPQPAPQAAAGPEPAAQPAKAADDTAERLAKANARQVQMAARFAAVELGVPASRAEYAARMADLSKVDVDEVDGPDADAVKKAIGQVLKDIPELKGTTKPADGDDKKQQPGIKIGADNSAQKPAAGAQSAAPAAARVKPWNKFRTF